MLTVQPFDPNSLKEIERAIQESDLGLNPSNDGKLIRLPIPQLTEERRQELVKVARQIAEEGGSRCGTSAATSSTTSRRSRASAPTTSAAPRSASEADG